MYKCHVYTSVLELLHSFYPYILAHTHAHTHITPPLLHMCMQTDVVDDIPTVKFVYIQWVGEGVKTMTRAKISTHKGDLEAVFKVSYSLRAAGVHVYTHMGASLSRMVSGCGLVAMVMITLL